MSRTRVRILSAFLVLGALALIALFGASSSGGTHRHVGQARVNGTARDTG